MKKISILIVFIATSIASYGQSIFDTLENMDEVSSVVVNKEAFELLSKFNIKEKEGNEGVKIFNMIKNLTEFKSFSTENIEVAKKMETMVSGQIKSRKLTQLMRSKDKESSVKIYVDTSKNKEIVNEVLMFVRGISKKTKGKSEAIVVSLTGKINLNELSKIAEIYE